jgi:hypothetical protein
MEEGGVGIRRNSSNRHLQFRIIVCMKLLGQSIRNYGLLFFLLPLLYFQLYGPYGFADTDQGFVTALAYRVHSGEMPYRDFVYVRPPLTPVLHSLELYLPATWQVPAGRMVYYLMLWGSVLFGLSALGRQIDFEQLRIPKWWLGCLAFLFAAHNFPAMPWHTVDGVFLGAMGIWGVTHRKGWVNVLGLLALAVGALAKQPFAAAFFWGLLVVFVLHGKRKGAAVNGIALGLLAMVGLVGWLALPSGFWDGMATQVFGAGTLQDLIFSGLKVYLTPAVIWVLPVAGVYLWNARRNGDAANVKRVLGILLLAGLALIPLAHAGLAFWKGEFQPPRLGYFHALLLGGLLLTPSLKPEKAEGKDAGMVMLMMGVLAWASGISWGMPVPGSFALPGVFGLIYFVTVLLDFEPPYWMRSAVLGLVMVGFGLLHGWPYRDGPRSELAPGAGVVFNRLENIRTGTESLNRLAEFYFLYSQYHDPYVVLPAMPAAHYLTQTKPPIGVDWAHDGEIGAANIPRLTADLDASKAVVFVELTRMREASLTDVHYRSELLAHVLKTWRLVETRDYFGVYLRDSMQVVR